MLFEPHIDHIAHIERIERIEFETVCVGTLHTLNTSKRIERIEGHMCLCHTNVSPDARVYPTTHVSSPPTQIFNNAQLCRRGEAGCGAEEESPL